MDIAPGTEFGELVAMRVDYGRAVRSGDDRYYRCMCRTCQKWLSVRGRDLISGSALSCKGPGKSPCKKVIVMNVKLDTQYGDYMTVKSVDPNRPAGSSKDYYVVQCIHCSAQYSKRGDTIVKCTIAKCKCRQNISS